VAFHLRNSLEQRESAGGRPMNAGWVGEHSSHAMLGRASASTGRDDAKLGWCVRYQFFVFCGGWNAWQTGAGAYPTYGTSKARDSMFN